MLASHALVRFVNCEVDFAVFLKEVSVIHSNSQSISFQNLFLTVFPMEITITDTTIGFILRHGREFCPIGGPCCPIVVGPVRRRILFANRAITFVVVIAHELVVVASMLVLGQVPNVPKDPRERLLRLDSGQLRSGRRRVRRRLHGVGHLVRGVVAHCSQGKQSPQCVVLVLLLLLLFLFLSLARFFHFGVELEHFFFLFLDFSLASLILQFLLLQHPSVLEGKSALELPQSDIVARVATTYLSTKTWPSSRRKASFVDALLSSNGALSSPRFHGTHADASCGGGAVVGVLSSQPGARGNIGSSSATSLGMIRSRL